MLMAGVSQQTAIERLWIGHWPVPAPAGAGIDAGRKAFLLETCLRRFAVTTDAVTARALGALRPPEVYRGVQAYQFLLEVATGLKSAVPGETNVFGQFRRAWEAHRRTADGESVGALAPLIARVIADTRSIRRDHLQNIGGASYGPLVRRLLGAAAGDHVLFVGAGELARSMLPFFHAFRIGIWNRHQPDPAFGAAGTIFQPSDDARAASWAHHVIMTTPAVAPNDERWMGWFGDSPVRAVVHLGRRRGEGARWPAQVRGYDLDDVFELRRSQDNIRSLQLERARLACRETALRLGTRCGPATRRLAAG